jgi:phosphate transport system substrate-binding protein
MKNSINITRRAMRSGLMSLLLFSVLPVQAEPLTVGGTGAAMTAMQLLADEFRKTRPEADIRVLPAVGSSGAIKGVKSGQVDLGVSGRALRDGERDGRIEAAEFVRTPFVFVVAKNNPLGGLSAAELVDIYAGRRVNWPDGSRLRLILRPADDSDSLFLRTRFSPAMTAALQAAEQRPGMLFAATDQGCADMLEQTAGAFGALTLGQLTAEQRALKPLAFDGQAPTSSRYPYVKSLYLLTAPDAKPQTRQFVAFVRSDRGRALLGQLGFWSVDN